MMLFAGGFLLAAPAAQADGADAVPVPADADSPAAASAWLDVPMSDADRRHLLARTGIGVAPADYLSLEGLSRREGIDWIIAGLAHEPSLPMPSWTRALLPMRHGQADASDEQRQRFRHHRDAEFASLRAWWHSEIVRTESPQTERLVLLWHDLVPSDYRNTNRAPAMLARQNALLRRSHDGRWQDLLEALLQDGALLSYLNAGSNRRDAPNENLGREFLELFTLGEGHYTERDVRNAARALTGLGNSQWRDGEFQLRTWHQDRDTKTLFGHSGEFGAKDLVALTLARPAAARHLARVYWAAFISDVPPQARAVEALAQPFRDSGLDLGVLYRTVLQSEAFWASEHRAALVKSPVDVVSGLMRTLDYPKRHWQSIGALQDSMGMALFEPPNVAGWEEGDAYVSVGRLVARQKGVRTLLSTPALSTPSGGDARTAQAGMMMDAQTQPSMMEGTMPGASGVDGAPAMDGGFMQEGASTEADQAWLRIASDAYRGDARTRVLLQRGTTVLWDSGPIRLGGGRDTERLGPIVQRTDLSWQRIDLAAPPDAVSDADTVRVLYLNDLAGAGGDRNLYLDRVTLGDRTLLAIDGVQHSACVPDSPLAAGDLYCAGQVTLTGQPRTGSGTGSGTAGVADTGASASAVHLSGASERDDGQLSVDLVLDNLTVAGRHDPIVYFRVVTWPDRPAELRINSFSCTDGCLEAWPACAWTDAHFPAMRGVAVPLAKPARRTDACLAELERPAERVLLELLADSAPALAARVLEGDGARLERHRDVASRLAERIAGLHDGVAPDPAGLPDGEPAAGANEARAGAQISIDPGRAPRYRPPEPIVPVVAQVDSADALQQALASSTIDPATLLWPGIPAERLPGSPDQPMAQRIRRIVEHPAFQLR